MARFSKLVLDLQSDQPLYRQIADGLATLIETGSVESGERLPATRELAGQLGLNRATISAAYGLLEETGLIEGHVGRGSFVARRRIPATKSAGPDWATLLSSQRVSDDGGERLTETRDVAASPIPIRINFASSRPDQVAFPLATVRQLTKDVVDSEEAGEILQLGSSYGYGPLRRYLAEEAAAEGVARSTDSVLMTNGCQQALDLLARVFFGQLRCG